MNSKVEDKKLFCAPTHCEFTCQDGDVITTYVVPFSQVILTADNRGNRRVKVPALDLDINYGKCENPATDGWIQARNRMVEGKIIDMRG